jgi:hypothetical protein
MVITGYSTWGSEETVYRAKRAGQYHYPSWILGEAFTVLH